jgi:glycopeptide antibiotics resistance protein
LPEGGGVDYLAMFERAPSVPATIAAGVLLAVLVAAVSRTRRMLTALTGIALAVVLGVTLVPSGGWSALHLVDDVPASILANLRPQPGDLTAWMHTADGPLNVVLFVPLGFLLALLLRRPVRAALACAALSLAIECYQCALTSRVGAVADVVANSLGGAIGALVAVVVLAVTRPAALGRASTSH